ncbi:Autism susceptibility 2 protein [Popillia japonica]|uniref:Autism susceptibility 2 protein n=1 Tax=Popillia japonica TaxID=7064 RepID=A0AAW1KI28_POPJA
MTMRLQESATGQDETGQEKAETKEKEGHQETVDTPFPSPADDILHQGSDASSVIFGSAPASRKHEFPGALPPSLPLSNGTSNSPVPAPTPPDLPAPLPAPAQLPPPPPTPSQHPIVVAPSVRGIDEKSTPRQTQQPSQHPIVVAPSVRGIDEKSTPRQTQQSLPPPPSHLIDVGGMTVTATATAVTPSSPPPALPPPPSHLIDVGGMTVTATATAVTPSSPPPATSVPTLQQQLLPPPPTQTTLLPPQTQIPPQPIQPQQIQPQHLQPQPPPPVTNVQPLQPAPAAALVAHPVGDSAQASNHARTESPAVATPAVATSAPAYHPPYQPLYTPYSVHSNYSSPSAATVAVPVVATTAAAAPPPPTVTITASSPSAATVAVPVVATTAAAAPPPPTVTITAAHTTTTVVSRPPSPRGHSPTRERESYSNVSSLSRGSVTPQSCPPPTTVSSSLSLGKGWSGPAPQLSPAPPRPTPPLHPSFPAPMFTAPLPPPVSRASPLTSNVPPPPNPNPFSAESLFQTNQADMLRRELDNRFLATQDRSLNVAPPPYLRTEMHQHQHHHTHVHQHTTSLLPLPPPSSTLFPSPLFKDIPKLGAVESPFYRQNLTMPNYPGYTPSLLHPGLTAGPTPFVPPNHLAPFQPKTVAQDPSKPKAMTVAQDPSKPKAMKTGKWNAMHVRIAWEIYHHQQKSGEAKSGVAKDLLRPPTHLFSPSVHPSRPHEMPFPPSLGPHRPPTYDQPPHHGSLFTAPTSHIGRSSISPFTRIATSGPPFSVSPFASGRDLGLQLHDPWRGLQRTVPTFPSVSALPPSLPGLPPPAPWTIKPDPILEQREREERERQERERERLRREREERERREREEKQRRLEQQQQQERERERREKERREQERLERERERERILHQQRLAESTKQMAPVLRDRSPMRNGMLDPNEVRIKEEPRTKEEEATLLSRAAADSRSPLPTAMQPPVLDRTRVLPAALAHHYQPPPASHWPPPADPFYRYEHLRYNPLMDAMRMEEERAKMFAAYPPHPSHQLRGKDPGLMHLRPGPGPPPPTHKLCATPPTDLHKKEEPR